MPPALRVSGLGIRFRGRPAPAVERVGFTLAPGRTLALIGASGSGKSTTCRAVMGLLPASATVTGSVELGGVELAGLSDRRMRRHRGSGLAFVPQNPEVALNPALRVGEILVDAVRLGPQTGRREATARARELLAQVQLADPERVFDSYPHELSGGMRQRVVLAVALARRPRVLIADEPTTSLDPQTRDGVLELLVKLQDRARLAILLVSHDLELAGRYADDVVMLRAGRVVETFAARAPHEPERREPTREVVAGPPRPLPAGRPSLRPGAIPVLETRDLGQDFGAGRRPGPPGRPAVAGAFLSLYPGECVALTGQSGSGKSSLAQSIVHAPPPTSGRVLLRGTDVTALDRTVRRKLLGEVQLVFQDPLSSLDPTWTVGSVVAEPLRARGVADRAARRRRVAEVLDLVGLDPEVWTARPRELSGGQVQRVALARALAPSPSVLICDEAVSSVDATGRVALLALLGRLRDRGLACLFITHDRAAARQLGDRILVMHRGRLSEGATA